VARLPYVPDDVDDELTRLYFDGCRQLMGRIPNSARVRAHVPRIAAWYIPFLVSLQREGIGVLDSRTKELAILKVSLTNACSY
jgi:alkylhydroperoxidase family enzyme